MKKLFLLPAILSLMVVSCVSKTTEKKDAETAKEEVITENVAVTDSITTEIDTLAVKIDSVAQDAAAVVE